MRFVLGFVFGMGLGLSLGLLLAPAPGMEAREKLRQRAEPALERIRHQLRREEEAA